MEQLSVAEDSCQKLNYSSVFLKCCERKLWPMRIAGVWSSTSVGFFFIAAAIVGFVLNTFALVALSRFEKSQNQPGTSFVKNLALTQMVFCLIALPVDVATSFTKHSWSYAHDLTITQDTVPETVCYMAGLTKNAITVIHGTTLALIGLERYFKIVAGSEVHGRVFCRRNKWLIIVCNWILTWTFFGVFGNFGFSGAFNGCTLKETGAQTWHFKYIRPCVIAWVVLTNIAILVSCSKIFLHVRRSTAAVAKFSKSNFGITKDPTPTESSAFSSSSMSPSPDSTSAPRADRRSCVPDTTVDPVQDSSLPEHPVNSEAAGCRTPAVVPTVPRSSPVTNRAWDSLARRSAVTAVGAGPAKRDLYLVKMAAVTAGTYAFVSTPLSVLNGWDTCGQLPELRNVLWALCAWMPVFNFFIYVRANPTYRRRCLKLMQEIRNRFSGRNL